MPIINPSHDGGKHVGFITPSIPLVHHTIVTPVDSTVVASVTSIPYSEDYVHPTGQWGPFDTDNGQL